MLRELISINASHSISDIEFMVILFRRLFGSSYFKKTEISKEQMRRLINEHPEVHRCFSLLLHHYKENYRFSILWRDYKKEMTIIRNFGEYLYFSSAGFLKHSMSTNRDFKVYTEIFDFYYFLKGKIIQFLLFQWR